jgi:hypothetical protein
MRRATHRHGEAPGRNPHSDDRCHENAVGFDQTTSDQTLVGLAVHRLAAELDSSVHPGGQPRVIAEVCDRRRTGPTLVGPEVRRPGEGRGS